MTIMSSSFRHLDDSDTTTLLTLPLSDFSKTISSNADNNDEDSDDLVLVSLSNNSESGGLTMNDLLNSQNSVYILGDTSESDIAHSANAPSNHDNSHQRQGEDEEGANQYSSSFEPVAARLIVEPCTSNTGNDSKRQAKTLDLVRVETSNTYIVTPPMAIDNDCSGDQQGDSKRQKLSETTPTIKQQLVTMPARSIGVVPGENSPSCFFLDPMVLPQGHFANKLRTVLSQWVYNPLEPPSTSLFGYTTRELAHICRSSLSEIEYALSNRVYGAEDALVIPAGVNGVTRYGMLSEEGRQTVSMAIVSTLLESDLDLEWTSSDNNMEKTMELSPLMREVRSNWQREEGADNELADEVVWHGLRPIVSYNSVCSKDEIPKQAQLIVEEVAKLAAHNVFLRGTPRSASGWEEDEFVEAWSIRLPTMADKYQASMELLSGIAISEMVEDKLQWRYFPASGLPLNLSLRIKSMLAMRSTWTVEEAKPYFEKMALNESEIVALLKSHKK
eukprot:scaffold2280_cov158-Skeletonema_menzelii.AAC.5